MKTIPLEQKTAVVNNKDRKGDWIQTFVGKKFYPFDPRKEEIHIRDIAHSLSMQCRFLGHTKQFYSVAEHSVRVALECDERAQLAALLHDASEAYLCDIPRPIKPYIVGYSKCEEIVLDTIFCNYGLKLPLSDQIKFYDKVLLATEARDLMSPLIGDWSWLPKPIKEKIIPMNPQEAETSFLHLFARLSI